MNEKTVIILGMHRTGTSMVAGSLHKLGVNMGENLAGANWSNPFGHYEDKDFQELNQEILKFHGGKWDNPPKEIEIKKINTKYTDNIKMLIESRRRKKIWGWKDPRTSLTIKLYLQYLTNPYFIVCHRDINKIASSLKRRNGINNKEAKILTNIYEERISNFLKNKNIPRLDIDYENITNKPKENIEKIIKFLDLKPNKSQKKAAINFIMPNKKVRNISRRKKILYFITHPWKCFQFILK